MDHNYKVRCLQQKTDNRKYSFLNRTIKEWNSLPAEVFEPFPKNIKLFIKNISKVVRMTSEPADNEMRDE